MGRGLRTAFQAFRVIEYLFEAQREDSLSLSFSSIMEMSMRQSLSFLDTIMAWSDSEELDLSV